jgi:hypothetical protein
LEVAKQSNTIMEMIKDSSVEENNDDENDNTPEILAFPSIDSNALQTVFHWCEMRALALSHTTNII